MVPAAHFCSAHVAALAELPAHVVERNGKAADGGVVMHIVRQVRPAGAIDLSPPDVEAHVFVGHRGSDHRVEDGCAPLSVVLVHRACSACPAPCPTVELHVRARHLAIEAV